MLISGPLGSTNYRTGNPGSRSSLPFYISNQVHSAFFSFLIQFYVPFKIISAHISGWYENGRSTRKTIWQTVSRRSRTVIKGTPLSLTQFTPSKPCTRLPYSWAVSVRLRNTSNFYSYFIASSTVAYAYLMTD